MKISRCIGLADAGQGAHAALLQPDQQRPPALAASRAIAAARAGKLFRPPIEKAGAIVSSVGLPHRPQHKRCESSQ